MLALITDFGLKRDSMQKDNNKGNDQHKETAKVWHQKYWELKGKCQIGKNIWNIYNEMLVSLVREITSNLLV